MITYSLLLVFVSLYISGHATPDQTTGISSCSKFSVKKTFPGVMQCKSNGQDNYYTINFRSRTLASHTQFFIVTERFSFVALHAVFKDLVVSIGKERIIKDLFLHLFPSHYFW